MLVFNNDTKYKIEDLNLHDAEITKVFCDYNKRMVEIPVKLSTHQNNSLEAVLIFDGVDYTDISFYEPWGAGMYVNEVNVSDCTDIINKLDDYQSNNEHFCLSIVLNSGDKIRILALKMTYLEK